MKFDEINRDTDHEELAPFYLQSELDCAQRKVSILTNAMQSMIQEFLRYGSRPWAVKFIQETLDTCNALGGNPDDILNDVPEPVFDLSPKILQPVVGLHFDLEYTKGESIVREIVSVEDSLLRLDNGDTIELLKWERYCREGYIRPVVKHRSKV